MTQETLASVLKKSRAAQRASKAAPTAPQAAADAPTDNGSPATPTEAQGQPAPDGEAVRTDDSTLAQTPEGEVEGEGEEGQQPNKRKAKEQIRWDRLTAQLKAKDAELAELRSQVNGRPQTAPQTPAAATVGGHPDLAPLDGQIQQARSVLEWCEENPDGGEIQVGEGKTKELTAAEVRKFKARANATLSELSAERATKAQAIQEDWKVKNAEANKVVEAEYPFLNNPDAPEFAQAVEYLQSLPQGVVRVLQQMPDNRLLLGDLLFGRQARLAKASKPAATARPSTRPTPQPGRVAAAAPRVQPERKAVQESEAKFASSGRMSDFRQVLANRRRAARTAA